MHKLQSLVLIKKESPWTQIFSTWGYSFNFLLLTPQNFRENGQNQEITHYSMIPVQQFVPRNKHTPMEINKKEMSHQKFPLRSANKHHADCEHTVQCLGS